MNPLPAPLCSPARLPFVNHQPQPEAMNIEEGERIASSACRFRVRLRGLFGDLECLRVNSTNAPSTPKRDGRRFGSGTSAWPFAIVCIQINL